MTLSYLGLVPGLISKDGSTVVGRDGYLYICGGSNSVIDQYSKNIDDIDLINTASRWRSAIVERQAQFAKRGIAFTQIVIPEKSTIIPEHFPLTNISDATPLLRLIEHQWAGEQTETYRSILTEFRLPENRMKVFRRLDSHLTPWGANLVFSLLLNSMSLKQGLLEAFDQVGLLGGDLTHKFADLPFREEVLFPRIAEVSRHVSALEQVSYSAGPDGGHVGTKSIWKNPSAVTEMKMVAFGNSFFERGLFPSNLTWWFARWFKEVHFVWSPNVDYDYIDKIFPDLCVCQTIERFLRMPPRL